MFMYVCLGTVYVSVSVYMCVHVFACTCMCTDCVMYCAHGPWYLKVC